MRWTVLYRPSAQNQLANIWLTTQDQQTVADAADEVDRALSAKPLDVGESRDDNARILIEQPLTVLYEVYPDDVRVEVFAVSYWKSRK